MDRRFVRTVSGSSSHQGLSKRRRLVPRLNTEWPCALCDMHETILNAFAAQGRCGYRVRHLHAGKSLPRQRPTLGWTIYRERLLPNAMECCMLELDRCQVTSTEMNMEPSFLLCPLQDGSHIVTTPCDHRFHDSCLERLELDSKM